ncbi:MAG: WecB/TagA/CpsF family glycosyltransferase [Hyphomicrobiaceae bacterium]|nr:WecB/TagA/CpsF family glycosyltransferase [Hyphomicrobiaceae bacterium]
MRSQPRISIVTICFNDKQNLTATAESIRDQSSADFEWVVVDGASTDGTVDYLEGLDVPGMRWVSEPDTGIYNAFNKGVDLSRGDYVVFICAGDRFCGPDTLERTTEFMSVNPGFDMYYADSFEVDGTGNRFLRAARGHDKIWWNLFTHHQSIFYARSCFETARYNEDYRIGGDYALTAQLLHQGCTAIKMPFATSEFLLGGTSQQNYWKGEAENWHARRDLGVPLVNRAAIFAAHAVIRLGRTSTPALYRLLRYRSNSPGPSPHALSDRSGEGGPAGNIDTYRVADIEINCRSLDDALDKIMLEKRETNNAFSVYTLNLDHVSQFRRDRAFKECYSRAKFTLPDGFPIALAGRMAGHDVERACGSDLIVPLCKRAASSDMSVFLFGSTSSVLSECAEKLKRLAPGLKIAGVHAPEFGFDPAGPEADEAIEILKKSNADICFVALGAPKQELFSARCVDRLEGIAMICIGAGLDFIVGTQQRAPAFFQNNGMEWVWRLAHNPTRLTKRYLHSAYVFPKVLLSALRANRQRGASAAGSGVSAGE